MDAERDFVFDRLGVPTLPTRWRFSEVREVPS